MEEEERTDGVNVGSCGQRTIELMLETYFLRDVSACKLSTLMTLAINGCLYC